MQHRKAYWAEMSCNQVAIDSATYYDRDQFVCYQQHSNEPLRHYGHHAARRSGRGSVKVRQPRTHRVSGCQPQVDPYVEVLVAPGLGDIEGRECILLIARVETSGCDVEC